MAQDAIYGEGNTGPANVKKRKAAGNDEKKSAADIDFKVSNCQLKAAKERDVYQNVLPL